MRAAGTAPAEAASTIQEHEARIAALERLVGKQVLELEFLKGAQRQGRRPGSARSPSVGILGDGEACRPVMTDMGAPVPNAVRQGLGQAEPAFRFARQNVAAIRRDQPSIETGCPVFASVGWKIERQKGIFVDGGVALALSGKKGASSTRFYPITTIYAEFANRPLVYAAQSGLVQRT